MTTKIKAKEPKKISTKAPAMLVGAILLIVIVGAIIGYLTSSEDDGAAGSSGSDSEKGNNDMTSSLASVAAPSPRRFRCVSKNYPLKLGTCHADVAILQKHLKNQGAALGNTGPNRDGVDGHFGPLTANSALQFLGKDVFNQLDINAIRKKV